MTDTLTAEQAAALWAAVRDGFNDAEKNLREIIRLRAWEAEGFDSFADAWAAKMQGVRLAQHATQALVVYNLLAEQVPVPEITAMTGVGGARVERVRQQVQAGVPPEAVTLAPVRPTRTDARHLFIALPPQTFAAYERIARAEGRTLQDEAVEALAAWFQSKGAEEVA